VPDLAANTTLDMRVTELVARHSGCKPGDISVSDTLEYKLGLFDEEAEEFFAEYMEEFHVDISELVDRWSEYLDGTVATGTAAYLMMGSYFAAALFVAFALRFLGIHIGIIWLWAGSLILVILVSGYVHRWLELRPPPRRPQISIDDLILAAKFGRLSVTRSNH
jgi:hypothetical protein